MVDAGRAVVSNVNGKVKAVKLIESAGTHARRIGPPSVATGPESVRFTRKAKLDFPAALWSTTRGRRTSERRDLVSEKPVFRPESRFYTARTRMPIFAPAKS